MPALVTLPEQPVLNFGQIPNDVPQLSLVMATFLKNGGFTTGGMNFDAKLRRQSIDPADLFHAHIGGMDVLASSLLVAEKIVSEGKLEQAVQERYAGWRTDLGERIAGGKLTLAQLSDLVLEKGIDPKPRSGRQEALENLANRYV